MIILEEILLRESPQKALKRFARNRLPYCLYCGCESDSLEADHIKARSKGGATAHFNLAPACSSCNREKGNQDYLKWWRRSGHYDPVRHQQLQAILDDRRSLADFLVDTLAENPSFRVAWERSQYG
jgi:5-methylcytosine-specific restriction endonuclease McrA